MRFNLDHDLAKNLAKEKPELLQKLKVKQAVTTTLKDRPTGIMDSSNFGRKKIPQTLLSRFQAAAVAFNILQISFFIPILPNF